MDLINGGIKYGATDDFAFQPSIGESTCMISQATMLHQLGMDHTRLTYRYGSRDFRPTDVGGNVVPDVLA